MYLVFKLLDKVFPNNKFVKDDINGKRFFIVLIGALIIAGIALLSIQLWYR